LRFISFSFQSKEEEMNLLFHCLFIVFCCFNFASSVPSDDSDFIDEKGKALKNLKVVPGSKRSNVDYHSVEQEAGKAVLKLLDAKIGKKVNDAAKEVTDFLNDAVGHHAKQRAEKIQSDKEKEMSLLHLGAQKVLSNNDEQEKPKKNKDGSFLVHFKIPYIVTPVKEKPKAKKYHHKHVKKPHHLKKYHHRVLHHKHHHHHHHHPHVLDASKPAPQATYNPQTPASQTQAPPPNYNAIDLTYNGYNWTYNYSNDTSSDMVPCQGNCMDPCTQACSLNQDCCCCDPNMMAQMQSQMVPAPVYPPAAPPSPPMYQLQALAPAVSPSVCPLGCKRNCFIYCPRECCGVAGKRDKVSQNEGSGNEETADQAESDQKDNGSTNEAVDQGEEEKSDAKQSVEDNENVEVQNTNDVTQEESSASNDKEANVENED